MGRRIATPDSMTVSREDVAVRPLCLLLITLLLAVAWCVDNQPAIKPLPDLATEEGLRFHADQQADTVAWNRLHMVEAYHNVGSTSAEWDADAVALLDAWAHRFSGAPSPLTDDELLALCTKLTAAKCSDGLVRYCQGKTYEIFGKPKRKQTRKAYAEAQALLMASDYPAIRKAWATLRLIEREIGRKKIDKEHGQALVDSFVEQITACLSDGTYANRERLFIQHLEGAKVRHQPTRKRIIDSITETVQADHADTWYGHTLLGSFAVERAWWARGGGWASTVTEEGWAQFRQHLGEAENHLTLAWEKAPHQPMAALEMITVAMATRTELNERQWFDRAVAAEFDLMRAYNSLQWSQRPRWGGSYEQMLNFGLECAATKRYDTAVPAQLLDAIIAIVRDIKQLHAEHLADFRSSFYGNQELWAEVDAMLQGYINEPSQSSSVEWNRSLRIAMAWRFGHKDIARAEVTAMGTDRVRKRALHLFDLKLDTIMAEETVAPEDIDDGFERGNL